ncbi:MAG: metallophosphoesterase, partial [Phycisphaerales bacterium]|nr:metallophosphoesterase [Phycisphaerales bacterium]
VVRVATHPGPDGPPVDDGRRRFLINATAAAAVVGPGATLVNAAALAPTQLQVRRYRVPVRGLSPALDNLRLLQLSDSHLGPRVSAAYLRDVMERAVAMRPDLFLLTGDYVHDGAHHIDLAVELFRPLVEADSLGVIGTLGNHDWWADGNRLSRQLTELGVHMIDNDRIFLDAHTRELSRVPRRASLCIAGVGDLLTDVVDFDAALGDVHAETPRVLMSHNPDCAELADLRGRPGKLKPDAPGNQFAVAPQALRVDLMLSGHTHGGQVSLPVVGPMMVPSAYGSKYEGGLVQGPVCPVIVSRGIGLSLLPIRFRVPPELVEITLVAE